MTRAPFSRRTIKRLAIAAAYIVVYLALFGLARQHFADQLPFAPWNAAAALSFGLIARMGIRWGWLALAMPFVTHFAFDSAAHELLLRVVETALPAGAALALRGNRNAVPELGRLPSVVTFFGYAAASAFGIGFAHALVALAATLAEPMPALLLSMRVFLSTLVSIALVAPLFLVHDPRRWRSAYQLVSAETILQAGALAAIGWEVFGRFANAETHFFYLLFLPLAWVTTRHGQQGAALALAATYLAPLATDWAFGHQAHAIIELQIRLLALAAVALLLGAMVSERHTAKAQMLARQAELAHVQRLNIGWEMASALAHELNQPLTAAMNYAQAVQRMLRNQPTDLERAAEVLGKGIDRIERAGHIIHGLRDFMRKGDLRPMRMSVAEAVEDAMTLVSGEANVAGVVLHAGGLTGQPDVIGDKTQVVQILVNLARNAIQAIQSTGRAGTVAISAHVTDEGVEVAVADDGPGIDPAIAGRLFEPFVTTKEVGMGLGLSISKSILESQGGFLSVEPGPGGGTTFRFTLPLADREILDA